MECSVNYDSYIRAKKEVWPSGKALGWWADGPRLDSAVALLSILEKGCGLWTLSRTINKTLKWLSWLPVLMQESFWWWHCRNRCIISLFPHLHSPVPNKTYGFSGSSWKKALEIYIYISLSTHQVLHTYMELMKKIRVMLKGVKWQTLAAWRVESIGRGLDVLSHTFFS